MKPKQFVVLSNTKSGSFIANDTMIIVGGVSSVRALVGGGSMGASQSPAFRWVALCRVDVRLQGSSDAAVLNKFFFADDYYTGFDMFEVQPQACLHRQPKLVSCPYSVLYPLTLQMTPWRRLAGSTCLVSGPGTLHTRCVHMPGYRMRGAPLKDRRKSSAPLNALLPSLPPRPGKKSGTGR